MTTLPPIGNGDNKKGKAKLPSIGKKPGMPDLDKPSKASLPKMGLPIQEPQEVQEVPQEVEQEFDEYNQSYTEEELEEQLEEEDYSEWQEPQQEEQQGQQATQVSQESDFIDDTQDGQPESALYNTEPDEEEYIDYEEEQIVPIGGEKSKKSLRAKDVDKRVNQKTITLVIRGFAFLVIGILLTLGIKNTFFPERNYTREQVEGIALNAVGDTGFPIDNGRSFATEFLKFYLSTDPSNPQAHAANIKRLAAFYGLEKPGTTVGTNSKYGDNVKQEILSGPFSVQEFSVSPSLARYDLNVLVTDKDGNSNDERGNNTAEWLTFSINVYYNEENRTFHIHNSSPTLIPNYNIGKNDSLPAEGVIGNGTKIKEEMVKEFDPTIIGFIKAYGEASLKDYSMIVQYVPRNPSTELISGFAGKFNIKNNNDVIYNIYQTEDPNEWKVSMTVNWRDTSSTNSDNEISHKGKYIMTINRNSEGLFTVSKFVPYTYTIDPTAN